ASLAEFSQKDKRYHIKGVMGPDEFHEKYPDSDKPGLKDNAYTNLMVVWLLLRAKDILGILPVKESKRIMRKAGIKEADLKLWDDISRRMNVIINNEGIIAQFDGYFSLLELDWDRYRERYENIERLDRILKAEGKSPDSYKISKQADLLMLFYLLSCSEIKELFDRLGYKFEKDTLQKNYKYYIRRTSHGSTLSKVVHCYIADLLKQPKESWRWFQEVLESDIFDTQGGTVPEGIHLGVMGGSIDVVLRGFAGVDAFHDKIVINPSLPKRWHRIKFRINYKDTWISFAVTENQVAVYVQGRKYERFPVPFEINSKLHHISCAKLYRFEIKNRF
ncbi:MAG: glycosyl hydrolase family 65 protein, partial [Candidatus Omnitrophica bacterium]|nr:glycosyl hydrolase family 65 protein [Candidatus Omnitrophota bacterium]